MVGCKLISRSAREFFLDRTNQAFAHQCNVHANCVRPITVLEFYGFTVTITTPCDATGAENLPVNFPSSFFCHRSRTVADALAG